MEMDVNTPLAGDNEEINALGSERRPRVNSQALFK